MAIEPMKHGCFSADPYTVNKINELIDENERLDSQLYELRLSVLQLTEVVVTLSKNSDKVEVVDMSPEKCPCGYREECGVNCGQGHDNGQCTPWPTVDLPTEECLASGLFGDYRCTDTKGHDGLHSTGVHWWYTKHGIDLPTEELTWGTLVADQVQLEGIFQRQEDYVLHIGTGHAQEPRIPIASITAWSPLRKVSDE